MLVIEAYAQPKTCMYSFWPIRSGRGILKCSGNLNLEVFEIRVYNQLSRHVILSFPRSIFIWRLHHRRSRLFFLQTDTIFIVQYVVNTATSKRWVQRGLPWEICLCQNYLQSNGLLGEYLRPLLLFLIIRDHALRLMVILCGIASAGLRLVLVY